MQAPELVTANQIAVISLREHLRAWQREIQEFLSEVTEITRLIRSQQILLQVAFEVLEQLHRRRRIALDHIPAEQIVEILYPRLEVVYHLHIMPLALQNLLKRIALKHSTIVMGSMKCQYTYLHLQSTYILSPMTCLASS